MEPEEQPAFVQILETSSLTDIAMIRSALDAGEIRYYIQGENLRYLRGADPAKVMVAAEDAEAAVEILKPLRLNIFPSVFGQKRDEEAGE